MAEPWSTGRSASGLWLVMGCLSFCTSYLGLKLHGPDQVGDFKVTLRQLGRDRSQGRNVDVGVLSLKNSVNGQESVADFSQK
jgi:hypothetical protein